MIIKKYLRTLCLMLVGLLLSGQLLAATDDLTLRRTTSNVLIEEGSAKSSVELTQRQNISLTNFIPLAFLVVAGAFIFRKEDEPVEKKNHTAKAIVKKEAVVVAKKEPLKKVEKEVPKAEVKPEVVAKAKVSTIAENNEIKDLSIGQEQCQSTTAKKTRCKRKGALERLEVTIQNKKYRYLSCRQHSNNFKPYAGNMA